MTLCVCDTHLAEGLRKKRPDNVDVYLPYVVEYETPILACEYCEEQATFMISDIFARVY